MIFSKKKLQAHRNRAASYLKDNNLIKASALDIIERLDFITKDYAYILELGCRTGILTALLKERYKEAKIIATDISSEMLASLDHEYKFQLDEEEISKEFFAQKLDIADLTFDLVIFSLGLHWINDVQGFLKQVQSILKSDGIFIANFVGGGSLKELRKAFIEAEVNAGLPHSSHISPLIHFDDVTPLLQYAGFNDIIVDYEKIELEYKSPLALMKTLKNMGESNALLNISNYSISKKMIPPLADETNAFIDQINLISFIVSKNKNTIKLQTGYLDQ